MKVKNTSARVINLMHVDTKLTLIPGTDEVYEVTDCPDVQWYIDRGDLAEVFVRPTAEEKPKAEEKPGKKGKTSEK